MSDDFCTTASCPSYSEILGSLKSLGKTIGPPKVTDLVLTPGQWQVMKDVCGPSTEEFGSSLASVRFIKEQPLQKRVRTGKIIQKDRFAEYDREDMDWAEPAGLAEWETVDRESVVYGINQRLLNMGSMAFCSGFAMCGPGGFA